MLRWLGYIALAFTMAPAAATAAACFSPTTAGEVVLNYAPAADDYEVIPAWSDRKEIVFHLTLTDKARIAAVEAVIEQARSSFSKPIRYSTNPSEADILITHTETRLQSRSKDLLSLFSLIESRSLWAKQAYSSVFRSKRLVAVNSIAKGAEQAAIVKDEIARLGSDTPDAGALAMKRAMRQTPTFKAIIVLKDRAGLEHIRRGLLKGLLGFRGLKTALLCKDYLGVLHRNVADFSPMDSELIRRFTANSL